MIPPVSRLVVFLEATERKYEQIMKITGPNGKTANVLTAWIKENESSEPRLVTLYVTDKEGE